MVFLPFKRKDLAVSMLETIKESKLSFKSEVVELASEVQKLIEKMLEIEEENRYSWKDVVNTINEMKSKSKNESESKEKIV